MTDDDSFASRYLSAESIKTTAALVFSPTAHLVRVLEHVDLRAEHVVRKSTLEIEAPTSRFLIPIVYPGRDQLIDTLRIEESKGIVPITLGAEATHAVMHSLLRATAKGIDSTALDEQLINRACRRIPTVDRTRAIAEVEAVRDHLHERFSGAPLTREQSEFLRTMQLFCNYQPLFVPCDTDSQFVKVTFERDLSRNEIRWHGVRESLRFSFGRLPDELLFDISLANRARSYHFRLNAPPLNYVAKAECSRRIGADLASEIHVRRYEIERFRPGAATLKGAHPDSTGLCHVHLSKAGSHRQARHGLLLRVRVQEQPLGQLGGAVVRLGLTALATVAVWHYGRYVVAFPSQSLSSIVLALPGLIGASFFVTRPLTGTRGPLVARIGSVTAAAAAIMLSVALAAWGTSSASYRAKHPNDVLTEFEAPSAVNAFLEVVLGVVSATGAICFALLIYNIAAFLRAQFLYKKSKRPIM